MITILDQGSKLASRAIGSERADELQVSVLLNLKDFPDLTGAELVADIFDRTGKWITQSTRELKDYPKVESTEVSMVIPVRANCDCQDVILSPPYRLKLYIHSFKHRDLAAEVNTIISN